MKESEFSQIVLAIIVLTIVIGFSFGIQGDINKLAQSFFFSIIIILVAVFSKKLVALLLDCDVEHKIWRFSQYGLRAHQHLKKEAPAGIIAPLIITILSLGFIKAPTILTYETRALKRRAAKRFGYYSYTEMTDWHNGLIGAAGIFAVLLLALLSYLLPTNLEYLAKVASFYAFFNMLPISNLDGTQIFFGSRVLWSVLAIITLIFTSYALLVI
jgi:Zn-dependent protease